MAALFALLKDSFRVPLFKLLTQKRQATEAQTVAHFGIPPSSRCPTAQTRSSQPFCLGAPSASPVG